MKTLTLIFLFVFMILTFLFAGQKDIYNEILMAVVSFWLLITLLANEIVNTIEDNLKNK